MANTKTLHDAFIDELKDAYDAEKQLTKALPKMAKAATSPQLRAAFEAHLKETQGQIQQLERVFASLDEKVKGKHCAGIAGIIEEGKSIMEEDFDDATMDACLIAGGQRAEHYEIAAYGTLIAWAKTLEYTEAAKLLQGILAQEEAADKKLSGLAEGGINQAAAADGDDADEDDDRAAAGNDERQGHRPSDVPSLTRSRPLRARRRSSCVTPSPRLSLGLPYLCRVLAHPEARRPSRPLTNAATDGLASECAGAFALVHNLLFSASPMDAAPTVLSSFSATVIFYV